MSSFRLGHAATTGKQSGMQQEWKGITFDHRARERIYLYAMNEQIHELYRLENHFRAGVSVATDSID